MDSTTLNSGTYVVLVWTMLNVLEDRRLKFLKGIGETIYFKRLLFLVMKNLLVLEVIILIKNILLNVLLDIRATCAKIAFTMRLFTIKDLEDQNVVYVRQSLRTLLELLVSVFSFCLWFLLLFGLTFERKSNLNSQFFSKFSRTTLKQHLQQWTSTSSFRKP